MSIAQFHDTADRLHDTLTHFIEANMADTGLKSDDCQRVGALNAAFELNKIFNGTTEDDLILPDANHDKVFVELDRDMAQALIEIVNIATMSPRKIDGELSEHGHAATTVITDALVG
jgi:hypothetical protein